MENINYLLWNRCRQKVRPGLNLVRIVVMGSGSVRSWSRAGEPSLRRMIGDSWCPNLSFSQVHTTLTSIEDSIHLRLRAERNLD